MGRWSRRLAPLLIRFGGLSDGERVLDVGCGTGSLTFTLSEIANVAAITGVDLTPAFIDFARGRNSDPRISFRQPCPRPAVRGTPSTGPSRCWSCNSSLMRPEQWPRCAVLCGLEAR
jgi:SAM-dependent methyltransferase